MENFGERILQREKKDASNEAGWETIFKHINEYKSLWETGYIKISRHQKLIGFILPEQRKAQKDAADLEKKIKALSEKNQEAINPRNNLSHIIGNSVGARGFIKRFEEGKYYDKEFPVAKFKVIKEGVGLIRDYVRILLENDNIIGRELGSDVGYLGKFLDYFNCGLPAGAAQIVKLIKFFFNLEKGMAKEKFDIDGEKINREMNNLLDLRKIENNLIKINNRGEELYKLA